MKRIEPTHCSIVWKDPEGDLWYTYKPEKITWLKGMIRNVDGDTIAIFKIRYK